jgi:hypothetical protein
LWGNPRVATGIRADKKLYLAFKQVAIAKFGSTCRAIEPFMAAIVGTYKQEQIDGASPTNTRIDIGKIVIERNLQPRRKLKRTHTEIDSVEIEDCCGFANCDKPATAEATYLPTGETRKLCDTHVRLLTTEGAQSVDWRFY